MNDDNGTADKLDQPGSLETHRGAKWWSVTIGVALVAATVAAYIPALESGYVWDDPQYLHENSFVQKPDGLSAIWELRYDRNAGQLRINTPQYYPLVYTFFWAEHRLWGLAPAGYHVVNVLLHAFSALLIWRIARRLGIPAGWFIAAVFALHPVQVESVAWITERKNVLSGVFYLLALLAALNYLERGRARWYVAGLALFIAALLSKTVTCSLPVVILLIRWYQTRRVARRDWVLVAPMLVIGLMAGLLTAYLERTHVGTSHVEWSEGFFERALLIAPRAFWFYAGKIAWPHPLIFIYPRWEANAAAWTSYLPLVGTLLAVTIAAGGIRRFGWGPLLLLAYSGVTLFPALGFFEVYPHRFSWVADHFQYLGCLGFIILYTVIVPWFAAHLASSRKFVGLGRAAGVCVLLVLAVLTFRQSRSYENEERLWTDTLAANPDAWIASLNLANMAAERGRYNRAAEYFEQAARHPAIRAAAYGNWGMALLRLQRMDGAIAKFQKALEVDPEDAQALAGLATAYRGIGRLDEAERTYQQALRLDPQGSMARLNLALLYSQQQRWTEAEECLQDGLRIQPRNEELRVFYAKLLTQIGRWDEAVAYYRTILPERLFALDALSTYVEALCHGGEYAEAFEVCRQRLAEVPNDARALRALARLRASCPVDALRDGAEAVRIATRLVRATGEDPLMLDTLARAQAEVGNFTAAVATAERALRAAERKDMTDLAKEIEARLQLFRHNKPYRDVVP